MNLFNDIKGHEQIVSHLKRAMEDHKPFHAYLFKGEAGIGKKQMARAFAAGLQCTSEGERPCGICPSCRQQASGNQPDIIWIQREKSSYSVDEIRQQLNQTIDVRPFASPYKIYVIPEADRMTESAQNALLKTIEEPPEYAIIVLLVSNAHNLLETIRSRCLQLDFLPLTTPTIEAYLLEKLAVPDYLAKASAIFAQGNLGKAIRYAKSSDFIEKKEVIFKLLKTVEDMTVSDILAAIQVIGENKDEINDYLDLMVLWYRDVLLFKATKDVNQLLFREDYFDIQRTAQNNSYNKIECVLQAFDKAKVRIRANVNFDLAMELLIMTMKENGGIYD